jgi:hypothetical protein
MYESHEQTLSRGAAQTPGVFAEFAALLLRYVDAGGGVHQEAED